MGWVHSSVIEYCLTHTKPWVPSPALEKKHSLKLCQGRNKTRWKIPLLFTLAYNQLKIPLFHGNSCCLRSVKISLELRDFDWMYKPSSNVHSNRNACLMDRHSSGLLQGHYLMRTRQSPGTVRGGSFFHRRNSCLPLCG